MDQADNDANSERTRLEDEDEYIHPGRFWQDTGTDFTLFNGFIAVGSQKESRPSWHPVRGKYDENSEANLVSRAIITRAQLEGSVEQMDQVTVESLCGLQVHLKEKILLYWAPQNSSSSYTTEFYVADDAPFDLLLNKHFIAEQGALFQNRSHFLLEPKQVIRGKHDTNQDQFGSLKES